MVGQRIEHSSHHHELQQVHSGAVDLSSTRIQDIYVLLTAAAANETAFKGGPNFVREYVAKSIGAAIVK